MHEYATVSASAYDPAALATKLTEKSADGWDVVGIVPTGSEVTAFLRREGGGLTVVGTPVTEAAVAAAVIATPDPVMESAPETAPAPAPVEEPAGWAVAPEDSANTAPAAAATVISGANDTGETPAASSATPAAASGGQPATPAGWYHDPSSRYELRYWDGSQWTEHVARGGQQYTDPPVA